MRYKGKIALCFLITRNLENWELWENWWKGYEDYVSFYFHISGKNFYKHNPAADYKFKTLAWERRIRTPHITMWGDYSLVMAEGYMYREALMNKENKYFCIISESEIPIRSFPDTYREIMSTKKNRLNMRSFRGYALYEGAIDANGNQIGMLKNCFPKKFIPISGKCKSKEDLRCLTMRSSHQWKILNRQGAKDFVRMIENKEYMNAYRECIVFDPTQLAPDELAFVNWIVLKHGTKGLIRNYINQETTYADFPEDGEHAITYDDIPQDIHDVFCGDPKIIFARKFRRSNKIQRHLPIRC